MRSSVTHATQAPRPCFRHASSVFEPLWGLAAVLHDEPRRANERMHPQVCHKRLLLREQNAGPVPRQVSSVGDTNTPVDGRLETLRSWMNVYPSGLDQRTSLRVLPASMTDAFRGLRGPLRQDEAGKHHSLREPTTANPFENRFIRWNRLLTAPRPDCN